MSVVFQEGVLSDIARVTMGQSPKKEFVSSTQEGLPLLNGPTEFGSSHPTPVQWSTSFSKTAEPGDILFCVRGSTTGRMNWADQQYAIGRGIASISAINPQERHFVRAAIDLVLPELLAAATGSTFPNVSCLQLSELPVALPSAAVRTEISGLLGALDDKIESNCAQQRIGEQLLRAVIEGILCQFSEADFISFDAYCTQSKESVRPENIGNGDKYIALEHMPRGSVFLNSWETAKLAGIASNKTRFRHGDLLFGKLRPYFKKVGVAPVSGVCSTDILVIRPRLPEFLPFIAVIASSDALIDSISASATGTRMPRASWKEIATWPVPQIPDETLTVLLHPANQLMAFLETLSLQNLKLAQLRDALLPELMSGRMRVDEAGCLVSEALDEEVRSV